MRGGSEAALRVAAGLGDHLARTAYRHEDRCTWMGTVQDTDPDEERYEFAFSTLGPELYGGVSGIALFLAELARVTGGTEYRDAAVRGITQALHLAKGSPAVGVGVYGGGLGTAYAAARAARLLERPDLRSAARALVERILSTSPPAPPGDVIGGLAGAIPALLALADLLDHPALRERAAGMGREMLSAATRTADGWTWADEEEADGVPPRGLTGFAHGAAGAGWALVEVFAATGDPDWEAAAREVFRYENTWYRPEQENWPDFREHDESQGPAPCAVAWCHGAPGIGLARLRAWEVMADRRYREDAEAAARTTLRALRGSEARDDASLCHGWTGLGDCLLTAADTFGDVGLAGHVLQVALDRAEELGADPGAWRGGLARGYTPSLMVGLAGVGLFFLRLADPAVPTVLRIGPAVSPGAAR